MTKEKQPKQNVTNVNIKEVTTSGCCIWWVIVGAILVSVVAGLILQYGPFNFLIACAQAIWTLIALAVIVAVSIVIIILVLIGCVMIYLWVDNWITKRRHVRMMARDAKNAEENRRQ